MTMSLHISNNRQDQRRQFDHVMTPQRVLGVDPGVHGFSNRRDRQWRGAAVDRGHRYPRPQHAYIERAQAMPRQGASSGFKFGRATGALEAVLACCEIPLTIVEPSMWKKFYRLPGKDKEAARQRALQLFPAAHAMLARKKDHGRAEAMLIALHRGGGDSVAR